MEGSLLGRACALLEREAGTPRGSALPTTGPLMILLLAMDDAALDAEVTVGRHLLGILAPLLHNDRAALLEEARRYLLDHSNQYWESRVAREFGSAQCISALLARTPESDECKGKKKLVLAHCEAAMERDGAASCASPLLQLVYPRRGKPLALVTNKFFGDAESWRTHICVRRWEQLLCLQHRKLLHSCQSLRGWNEELATAPFDARTTADHQAMLSIVEVPSPLQRTLKFYVDWDMKVVDTDPSAPAEETSIEKIRQLALGTPRAVARILRNATRISDDDELFALVKEGTRRVDEKSTKVSFHFVFQLLVTHAQFRQLYEDILSFLAKDEACVDVARALELTAGDSDPEEARSSILLHASASSSSDPPFHALVGLDLHPRQNAAQGLASLGARKSARDPGTRVVGMVSCDTGRWVEGYVERSHPLAVLADASIAVPGPRCIGIVGTRTDLRGVKKKKDEEQDRGVRAALARIHAWERLNVSPTAHGNLLLSTSTAKLISRVSETLGTISQGRNPKNSETAAAGPAAAAVTLEEVVGAMPRWFKRCLLVATTSSAAEDVVQEEENAAAQRQFATANVNMKCLAKIGRPHSVATKDPRACRIVHVHGTEVCMCTRSLMEVPFKAYERHGSNGVLYCFYRDQVFVSCLKEECCRVLRATRDSMRAMSRVLEECVFCEYGNDWRTHHAVVHGTLCKEQRDQIERIEDMKRTYMTMAPSCSSSSSRSSSSSLSSSLLHDLSHMSMSSSLASSSSSCGWPGAPAAPVNIRRFAKVPSRNIVSSGKTPSARRTWVEITEPMLRSYMSWACHSSRGSEKEDSDEKDMRAKVDKALKKMRASATFVYNPYG